MRRMLVMAAAGLTAAVACAQDYPLQPVKLLVGFSPGGGLDISCRHWAERLGSRLKQPVVVENRPGASGEISIKQAVAAKPDGYTLVCLSGSNTISSAKAQPPFDIRTDVAPIIQMTHFTFVLYVNPKLPAKTLAELIAYSKANPGTLNYGSVGTGSTPHLAMEYLKLRTGLDAVHIPYKGTAQTAAAAIAGDIEIGLDAIAAVKPHFDAGTLRPIAVVSAGRTPMLPNVPGMRESGVADVDIGSFSGIAAPARTPPAVVLRLNRELNAVLAEPETRTLFFTQGYEVAGGTPQDFARVLAAEVAQWSGVVHAAKITFD
ncbi:MAG TPA: tripartite tricarboxylate transporter substrate-binding protein [Casimicrobiaceae bacterium]|nr:tripartite tricarboxylate transporter substrate-binding protein [Casimicrobiaceae bacterium]